MERRDAFQNQPNSNWTSLGPGKLFFQGLPDSIKTFFLCFAVIQVHSAYCPAQDVNIVMLDFPYLSFVHGNHRATLGSGFSYMPSLDVTWKNNPWFPGYLLTLMNMP
jgi:hypothetical protein